MSLHGGGDSGGANGRWCTHHTTVVVASGSGVEQCKKGRGGASPIPYLICIRMVEGGSEKKERKKKRKRRERRLINPGGRREERGQAGKRKRQVRESTTLSCKARNE